MKFTPGDWTFGVREDGSLWLSLGDPEKGPHYQGDLTASVADAHLLITSRDLYEALELLLTLDTDCPIEGCNCQNARYTAIAQAALKKARGEA